MQLSRAALSHLSNPTVIWPPQSVFNLPEKVLQFGTGVLLRGLPDYFIDKANRAGLFNGRVVVVKSTSTGDADAFDAQDGLYTLCIRGVVQGQMVSENRVCSAISRVLAAGAHWASVLQFAASPQLSVIISNTTEVGIQLVDESIFQNPPRSFPAKLLAVLYERFKKFPAPAPLVILPTELLSENGKKLEAIVMALAQFNALDAAFFTWVKANVHFCDTLVDCIVPGRPDGAAATQLEAELGYSDNLLAITEVYRLWAIEAPPALHPILSFAQADDRVLLVPDITRYKELKLRLLNGTHTASCGLMVLAGFATVKNAMEDDAAAAFLSQLLLRDIAPAIPYAVPAEAAAAFGQQVLDRFRNPYLQHAWLSITLQYTSKMAMRVVPVLVQYAQVFGAAPHRLALGFAAYLLFMKSIAKSGDAYIATSGSTTYEIKDDSAPYFFDLWQRCTPDGAVAEVLRNTQLWQTDLSVLPQFEATVQQCLHQLLQHGARHCITQNNIAKR